MQDSRTGRYFAFFDVDGTLLNLKSMMSFLRYYYQRQYDDGNERYLQFVDLIAMLESEGKQRGYLNRLYYQNFKGCSYRDLIAIGDQWYQDIVRPEASLFIQNLMDQMIWNQKSGAEIVLVSGSMWPCLSAFVKEFQIDHCLAANLEVKDDLMTGELLGVETIGIGKSIRIRQFLKEQQFTQLDRCYAYGDHVSDIPMLEMVGNPRVVAGDNELVTYARQRQWTILSPVPGYPMQKAI